MTPDNDGDRARRKGRRRSSSGVHRAPNRMNEVRWSQMKSSCAAPAHHECVRWLLIRVCCFDLSLTRPRSLSYRGHARVFVPKQCTNTYACRCKNNGENENEKDIQTEGTHTRTHNNTRKYIKSLSINMTIHHTHKKWNWDLSWHL